MTDRDPSADRTNASRPSGAAPTGLSLRSPVRMLLGRLFPPGTRQSLLAGKLARAARNPARLLRLFSANSWRQARRELEMIRKAREAAQPGMTPPGPAAAPDDGGKAQLRVWQQARLTAFLHSGAALTLPAVSQPLVSIVMTVFNRAEYTYSCIESLLAHADVPYELIIVDNASSDETGVLLSKIHGARVVRMEENAGFLLGTNRGAQEARGTYVLLLNNDTQLLPESLSRLVEAAAADPACGAVGPRLILPDGRLQEAGSIIWSDGSCLGYGRGSYPFAPPFSYRREVDYVSGACLLVPRGLFAQLGMLDPRYAPAYYEETDLCMRLREAGYKVIYEPAASIVHYEFGSLGSMEQAIRQQQLNRDIFAARWGQVLEREHYSPDVSELLARERGEGKRILYVEDCIPDPSLGAGYPRSLRVVETLAQLGYKVTLFPFVMKERTEPLTQRLQRLGVEVFYEEPGETLDFVRFYGARLGFYDLVFVCRPHNMAEVVGVVKALDPAQRFLYEAEAIFAWREILKRQLEGRPYSKEERERLLRLEMGLMSSADLITTVSAAEQRKIQQYTARPVQVISHCETVRQEGRGYGERSDLLFVGSLLHPSTPNEDSLLYFVREIFPIVRERLGCKLWIVGSNQLDSIWALQGEDIVVTGAVPELEPYYEQARVFVVPTRYAAGVPQKLLESMAYGVPAVVTPLIADQLELDERTVQIGQDAAAFAGRIIALYENERLWQSMREQAQAYMAAHHSPAVFRASVAAAVGTVLGEE